jgi:N-acetylglucosamine kinase-like BadF-type ATPase
MSLFMGIEGIAMRHCVGVLSNDSGHIISAKRLLGQSISLHTTNRTRLRTILCQLIKTVFEIANMHVNLIADTTLCIGLTGATFSYDREVDLPNEFEQMEFGFKKIICTGDAEIIFASHTQDMNGSAIICHCGSTAYHVNTINGEIRHIRYGGWGPALGDEGSAYFMGKEVLRAIGDEHDRRQIEKSTLWTEVNKWLFKPDTSEYAWHIGSIKWAEINNKFNIWLNNTKTQHDPRTLIFYFSHIVNSLDESGYKFKGVELWRRIASGLSIPLMSAYAKGDKNAVAIIDKSIKELVQQHKNAIDIARTKGWAGKIDPIVLYGGIINHNPSFTKKLKEKMCEAYSGDLKFITNKDQNTMRPVCGALLYALNEESKTNEMRLPNKNIINNVLRTHRQYKFERDLYND